MAGKPAVFVLILYDCAPRTVPVAFESQNSFSWCFVNDMNVSGSHLAASSARPQLVADRAQLSARSVPSVAQDRPGVLEVLAAMLLFVAVGIDYSTVLDYRVEPFGVPVSAIDVLLFVLLLCGFLRSFRGTPHAHRIPRGVLIAAAALATVSIIGVIGGMKEDYALYDIVKDFRLALYLLLSFWLFTLIPLKQHLGLLTWVLIVGGVAVAIQVLAAFYQGYFVTGQLAAARAVWIPAQILTFAIFLLMAKRYRATGFFRRSLLYACVLLFLMAMLLSLTRSIWIQLAMTTCFLGLVGRRLRRVTLVVLMLTVLTLSSVGLLAIVVEELPEELRTRIEAFSSFLRGEERGSLYSRFDEASAGMHKFYHSPVLGRGFGTTIESYDQASRRLIVTTFMHNSAVFYLLKLGIVGALAFFSFCALALFRALRVPADSELVTRARLLFSLLAGFMVTGNFSGNLNYAPFMILLGALFAQSVLLSLFIEGIGDRCAGLRPEGCCHP